MAPKKSQISIAIDSIEPKKENLRKAFEDLQSHSSSLASFTLQWKDLEDHFASIRKTIDESLKKLEAAETKSGATGPTAVSMVANGLSSLPSSSSPEIFLETKKILECETHPDLKAFCSKMDGKGLRSYILDHRKDLTVIREEVGIALGFAADPAKLVLDGMGGYYGNPKGDKDGELAATRRTCILLLEELSRNGAKVSQQVKERAKKLAVEWKGKISSGDENPLEKLGLLQLVASYGLTSEFNANELLDLAVGIAKRKQALELVKGLGLPEKIPDFIEKLTNKGKYLEAVKFVYAFDLVDKFPPVPLLKAYQKQSKKIAQETRTKGNNSYQSLNESIAKEHAAVKNIIKCIEEYNLESEFPRNVLDKRIEQLDKQKADRKRAAAASGAKKQQQLSGNKRPRTEAQNPVGSTVPSISQTHMQPTSSFLDRAPYITSSAQFGMIGNAPSVAPYMTSAVGSYGLGVNHLTYGGGRSPPRSFLYSSESQLPSGLYDRSLGLGGPGMPPSHRSSYYP